MLLRKLTAILVTVLTLGAVTPTDLFQKEIVKQETNLRTDTSIPEFSEFQESLKEELPSSLISWDEWAWHEVADTIVDKEELLNQFKSYMVYQADIQAVKKFGPRIRQKVDTQYRETILPRMEEVIDKISRDVDKETLRHIAVTKDPSSGLGEKIFHLYDRRSGTDLVRFHVRREHPPQQGYWFNFHYHKQDDNFENHYELGKIYWDKNIPPRWMA